MDILLATHNRHKAEELSAILSSVEGLNIISLQDLAEAPPEPIEDGATLEANAYIKAREIFMATGLPTIADDTGLEVTALGGAPGIFSARYAGDNASYEDNCKKLLEELRDAGSGDRSARFRTVICYTDAVRTLFAEGEVAGEILAEPRGTAGFGYDPLFRSADDERTFAELSPEEKNRISHRGRALAHLARILMPYVSDGTPGHE